MVAIVVLCAAADRYRERGRERERKRVSGVHWGLSASEAANTRLQ